MRQQVTQDLPHLDAVTGLGAVGGNVENPGVNGLDFLSGFVALECEERLALLDKVSVFFQPIEELAFLHGPPETRQLNFDGHDYAR